MQTEPVEKQRKLIVVVTARQTSTRLPGKSLLDLRGRPMLAHLLDRLRSAREIDEIVVATSTEATDDPVAAFATTANVAVHRGALHDVLGRVWDAATAHEADAVIRISGDSPLLDPRLVARAIEHFGAGADLVSNVFPRSFPKGQSVEIISRSALQRLMNEASDALDREHVTRYAYRNPDRFIIHNFSAQEPRPEMQLSVDTLADFRRLEALLDAFADPDRFPTVEELVRLADKLAVA